MTCIFTVIEVGQEYLDWATKLRRAAGTDAVAVTHDDAGYYAVQSSGGEVVADGFPDRDAAEEYVDHLFVQSVSLTLDGEIGEDNRWCRAWADGSGTKGAGFFIPELKAVTIVFDYPPNREARLEFKSETGFTREEIIECIRAATVKIFTEAGRARAPRSPICCLVRPSNKEDRRRMGYLMIARADVTDTGCVTLRIKQLNLANDARGCRVEGRSECR